jgi:hypothetical protein
LLLTRLSKPLTQHLQDGSTTLLPSLKNLKPFQLLLLQLLLQKKKKKTTMMLISSVPTTKSTLKQKSLRLKELLLTTKERLQRVQRLLLSLSSPLTSSHGMMKLISKLCLLTSSPSKLTV